MMTAMMATVACIVASVSASSEVHPSVPDLYAHVPHEQKIPEVEWEQPASEVEWEQPASGSKAPPLTVGMDGDGYDEPLVDMDELKSMEWKLPLGPIGSNQFPAGMPSSGAPEDYQLPKPPVSCPTYGCFPCEGCFCKAVWDEGEKVPYSECKLEVPADPCGYPCSCPRTDSYTYGELQRELDVPYGKAFNNLTKRDQTLLLNLYQPPASDTRKLRPAVVCMTGGAFNTGDRNKAGTTIWAKHFAARGFVAITIDYRLEKKLEVEEPVLNEIAAYDAKAAVRWLVKHSTEYRISKDHIVAFGSSAGGMISAWLTGVHDAEGASGNPGFPSNVTAGVALSAFLFPAVTGGKLWADQPPYLDFHGTADPIVPFEAANLTQEAMVKAGINGALIPIPDAGHVPWSDVEERADDLFGFVSTYARLGELECPKK